MSPREPALRLVESGSADDWVRDFSWSSDSRLLLASPTRGSFLTIEPASGHPPLARPGHGFGNGSGCFFCDDKVLLPSHDGKARVYVERAVEPSNEIGLGRGMIEKVAASPGGNLFACAAGKALHVFDRECAQVAEYGAPRGSVLDFCWGAASSRLAVAGNGGFAMYRVGGPDEIGCFQWAGVSERVAWSANGRWVATGSQTPDMHFYDCGRDYPLHIRGYASKVKALAFSPDSGALATASGNEIIIWDCTGPEGPEGSVPFRIDAHSGECAALGYSPGGEFLASGGREGALFLFDCECPQRPAAIAECKSPISALAWSPDGRYLALGTEGGAYFVFGISR